MTTALVHDTDAGFHWGVVSVLERYSADQARFAEREFAREQSWRGIGLSDRPVRGAIRRLRYGPLRLQGEDYRRYFPRGPEDGVAEAHGNLLVTAGLTAMTALLTGTGGTTGKYAMLASSTAVMGVGSTTTAAVVGDTHLGADGTAANGTVGAWYQAQDATYPTVSAGVMSGQCTYAATASSAFAWQEWCWASGTGTVTAGATLASIYGTAASYAMWNHKIISLGTKASSASWVFTNTVTLS